MPNYTFVAVEDWIGAGPLKLLHWHSLHRRPQSSLARRQPTSLIAEDLTAVFHIVVRAASFQQLRIITLRRGSSWGFCDCNEQPPLSLVALNK